MIRAQNLSTRLFNILAARGKTADFSRDCKCVDNSDGLPPRLAFWDEAKLGPVPTQDEIDAASEISDEIKSENIKNYKLVDLLVEKGVITIVEKLTLFQENKTDL